MLFMLFEPFFPNGGITKDGWRAEELRDDELKGKRYNHRYNGPVLDLVLKLLDVEGIKYKSRGAIGQELWQFAQTANADERPRVQ